jgi:pSer/pThr/pTyr-binding forkhead associated (FHA) protein
MNGVLAKAFGCAAAGAVAWILCEPAFPKTLGATMTPQWASVELVFIFLVGAFIGQVAGLLHGARQGGKSNVLISGALGFIFGAMGAGFGHTIAGLIFTMLGGSLNSPTTMGARTFAFLPLGLLIGAAVGASQRSLRSLVSGAIGGAIAGFVTGAVFDPISNLMGTFSMVAQAQNVANGGQVEIGAPGRAVMSVGLGLFIGLFTSLVDLATRRAWLRLVLGRNEGREWPIDAVQTLIGRDERAHVPIFADPNMPTLAAVIVRQNGQYVLKDPGSPIGVGHNGVRVPQAVLSNGDTIQIGSLTFQFMMKAGAAAANEGRAKGMPVGVQQHFQGQQPQVGAQGYAPLPAQAPYQAQQPTAAYQAQQNLTVAAQPMQPQSQQTLVVASGPMTGQRFMVANPLEIGREGAGVALSIDAQASRRHALVSPTPAGLQVTDMGSTNGTFVNGQRVQTSALKSGDVLTIGSTTFRVE